MAHADVVAGGQERNALGRAQRDGGAFHLEPGLYVLLAREVGDDLTVQSVGIPNSHRVIIRGQGRNEPLADAGVHGGDGTVGRGADLVRTLRVRAELPLDGAHLAIVVLHRGRRNLAAQDGLGGVPRNLVPLPDAHRGAGAQVEHDLYDGGPPHRDEVHVAPEAVLEPQLAGEARPLDLCFPPPLALLVP